jgi:hypothetical protein
MRKQRKLFLKILCFLITACAYYTAQAQQNVTLSGKVTDSANNTGVQGVSVTLKGNSKTGTVTDANGNFKITVPQGSVLSFSSVNYATQEIQTGSSSVVNLVLVPSSAELNEVVVIGYGTRKRKDVTGAVSTVGAKDIEKNTSMAPELALQGRTPGVFIQSGGGDPQSRPIVRIRGVNTLAIQNHYM